MDTATLTDALRGLDAEALSWKFALYVSRKGRDGVELEWYLCNMQDIPGLVNLIREYLLKKPAADKPVARYSPFLSDKEHIAALENSSEMIHAPLTDMRMSIRNGRVYPPQDFISGKLPKTAGYAFYGEYARAENEPPDPVLFMRRGSPFLTGALLFRGTPAGVALNDAPVVKLSASVDFLSIKGVSYIFSASVENDLAFENRHIAIAEKYLGKIAAAEIISGYDRFEQTVMKIKNARKFLAFNEEILDYITGLPITDRAAYLEKFGVELDPAGRMDAYEASQSELIIDLLCGRSCLDPLNRLSVGSHITPRE